MAITRSDPFPGWWPAWSLLAGLIACSQTLRQVTVTGTDYAFGIPAEVAPGLTAFTFENHGKVRHEMNLFRLRAGVTVDSFRRVERGPMRRGLIEGGGILVAEPGEHTPDRLLVDLRPGQTYMVICNFQDAPDQPRHETLGMIASFVVK